MRGRHLAAVGLGLALLASAVSVQARVTPGGEIRDLAADPIRSERLYAVTDQDELVVVDVPSATITDRVPLPLANVRSLAVEDDGSRIWLGFEGMVVAIDALSLMAGAPIALSSPDFVSSVIAGRPGRLYAAVHRDGVAVIDTEAGVELDLVNVETYASSFAMNSDRSVLYVINNGLSPASLFAHDATTDELTWLGEDCCHGCIGSNGRQVAVSADDARLFVATGSPYYVQVLNAVGMLHEMSAVLTSAYPNAVAVSPDGTRLYIGHQDNSLVVADSASGLVLHRETMNDTIAPSGIVVAADGSWIAASREAGGFDPTTIELYDRAELEQTSLGAVTLRALDPVTMEPVRSWITVNGSVPDTTRNWKDILVGQASWGPAPPGDYEIEINATTAYETETRMATVVAGEWTDLGDIVLTRTGPDHPAPSGACVSPPLVPGRTMDVWINGENYVDGAGLSVELGPDVQVHSWEWETWSRIRANVTADPGIRLGLHRSGAGVTNPDGAVTGGSFAVGEWPEADPTVDRIPPEEVQLLFVKKRPDRLPGYLFEWTEVTRQVDGTPETMGDYQLRKGELRDHADAETWQETEALSYLWDIPPDGELPAFVTFKVRARDAAGNIGD